MPSVFTSCGSLNLLRSFFFVASVIAFVLDFLASQTYTQRVKEKERRCGKGKRVWVGGKRGGGCQ